MSIFLIRLYFDYLKEIKQIQRKHIELDVKTNFMTHVKVIYINDSRIEQFMISIETAEKKEKFTFNDLKEECCTYW